MQGIVPVLFFSSKFAVYIGCREESLCPSFVHSFLSRRKRKSCCKGVSPCAPLFSGKRTVYICYVLFLSVRPERKSTKKKEVAAQNGLSLTEFADDGAANSLRSDAA